MPIFDSAATELAQLLGSGTAGELIPELVRQRLQALIKAEAAAALGADRDLRTAERRATARAAVIACWRGQQATSSCTSHAYVPAAFSPRCWSHAGGWTGPCGRW